MVDWVYDELVLAADLVSRNGWTGVRAASPEARSLSALLRRGQLHGGEQLPANFRSGSSIQRKTYDLATADEAYAGKPTRGGRLDALVISAFRADITEMQARAAAIGTALNAGETLPLEPDEVDDVSVREGGILEHIARRRERDRGLRSRKLRAVLDGGGLIACEVCGFDFGQVYGERGEGYIEVHHVRPLHVSGETDTKLDDLALLCANCHRVCHRGAWITPAEVRLLVTAAEKTSAL
ncbi:HNH endonuclease [Microbacterium sp. Gd 4-13]|uniref:HNH endonuclease n=1 Tax=Microbacterium sp. Gd 4-13 TaxID=2173179 RepID=UPI000D582F1D|nr:HNH endonuclease [Microbacterium sp. Gd 4-13]PVW05437.1 HNH endonuclease [Microbacterium sp. Gd 4-13]